MGAADVVPGVSGGTIAFIAGIYERLLAAIHAIGPGTLGLWRREGAAAAWRQVDGGFLLTLGCGIVASVLLLARPVTWLLEHQPVLIWSFFFGLIAASVVLCGKRVRHWSPGPVLGLAAGTALAWTVGVLQPATAPESLVYYFLAGALAICAMILPGISGSFILLLLGAYLPVMQAIKSLDLVVIAVFGAGCVTGLMAFSRLLTWMFRHRHDLTVATLSGFLLGSLSIVWPWKQVLSVRTVHPGRPDEHLVPLVQTNVLPADYAALNRFDLALGVTDKDPRLAAAVLLCLLGAGLLLLLERIGTRARPG